MKLLVLLIVTVAVLFGDESSRSVVTAQPANARFEIVQSEISAKATFKLDRYTGRVWQLLSTPSGNIWSRMYVEDLVLGVASTASTAPRFQIFTSGLALKFTYLIDTVTGNAWELASSEKGNDVWQLVRDKVD